MVDIHLLQRFGHFTLDYCKVTKCESQKSKSEDGGGGGCAGGKIL